MTEAIYGRKIRIAVVGCGRIAGKHFGAIEAHGDNLELVAVCDSDPEVQQKVAEERAVRGFRSMREMLESVKIDLVALCTPSGLHPEETVLAASYGVHVMTEKPMALTLEDADSMIRACDEARVKLFVVKQNRFNRPVVKLREALEGGRFGKLVMGTVRVRWCRPQGYYDRDAWRGTWALDGGVLANQASHHVDLLEWMMGEVESVVAMTRRALVDIEAEDTAAVLLRFSSGALGIIEATTATRPKDLEGSISILGEKGTVEIGGFAVNEMKTWNFTEPTAGDREVRENYSVNPPNVYGFGHLAFYEHAVRALTEDGPNLVDGLEGRKSLELINAIYESVETGKEVALRFKPKHSPLGRKV